MGISNHLYILTGASRGLGAAMAERLLKPGHSLICISRSTNAGLARVADTQGAQLVQWQQDLADGPAVSRRVDDWLAQSERWRAFSETDAGKTSPPAPTEPTAQGAAGSPAPSSAPSPSAPAEPSAQKKKLSYKEQREWDALPGQIEALEAEQTALRAELADGSLYSSNLERAMQLQTRDGEIEAALMNALERWEALAERAG